jgi:hypothetical protein
VGSVYELLWHLCAEAETVRWQSSKPAPFAQSVVTTTFIKLIIVVVLTTLA